MKVSELIEELERCPAEAEVMLATAVGHHGEIGTHNIGGEGVDGCPVMIDGGDEQAETVYVMGGVRTLHSLFVPELAKPTE